MTSSVNAYLLGLLALKASEAAKETGADEEPMEDLLKPGHLTRLLEEELATEVEALSVADVSRGVEQLLGRLKTHRDSCQPQQLQVAGHAVAVLSFLHSAKLVESNFLCHLISHFSLSSYLDCIYSSF